DAFIKTVYQSIKEAKPYVKFGISPFGTWQPGYPARTGGFNAYTQLYADARLWLREGWVDYFTPQIYNRIDRVIRPFPVMLQWWTEQNRHDRHIWPGLYTSRAAGKKGWPTEEITGQIYIARGHPGVTGSVHFSMRSLLPQWSPLVADITSGPYALPALIPTSPWIDKVAPAKPSASIQQYAEKLVIELQPKQEEARWWTMWSKTNGRWALDSIPGSKQAFTLHGTQASVWPQTIAVSAVDRNGNESKTRILESSEDSFEQGKGSLGRVNSAVLEAPSLNIVKRNEWGPPPGGFAANAVRRNLTKGDDLRFRDLKLKLKKMISGTDTAPDTARIVLSRNEVTEELTFVEGEAFNWNGYHIGVLAVNTDKEALAGGLVEFEIATVSSLPIARAAAQKVGDASQRLRVPHKITQITLHHTGSAKPL